MSTAPCQLRTRSPAAGAHRALPQAHTPTASPAAASAPPARANTLPGQCRHSPALPTPGPATACRHRGALHAPGPPRCRGPDRPPPSGASLPALERRARQRSGPPRLVPHPPLPHRPQGCSQRRAPLPCAATAAAEPGGPETLPLISGWAAAGPGRGGGGSWSPARRGRRGGGGGGGGRGGSLRCAAAGAAPPRGPLRAAPPCRAAAGSRAGTQAGTRAGSQAGTQAGAGSGAA